MSLFKSIATFGGFTLVSRITGFLRDVVLANFLGAGMVSDAFLAAFKIPNLFRSLFAEGAFTTAFVPMLSHKLVTDDKATAMQFAAKAISTLTFFSAIFVILVEIFMPYVVVILAPGFAGDPAKLELTTTLSRITFPFLFFISIVSFQSGILNSLGKFAAPAAAPVILNLMMIVSVFIFIPLGFTPANGISISVTFAGFIEVLCLRWFLHRQDVYITPHYNMKKLLKDSEIRTLFKRIAPGILGAGIYQINTAVDLILVSLVGNGAISWLYYAHRLEQLPLGVVGAAISVALLPILSAHLKSEKIDEAKQTQDKAIEYGALLSIPAAVGLIVLAEPIINILFQHGKFTAFDTAQTAVAVIAYSIGLPFYVLVKSMSPNFFARGDTKTPVKYSAISFLVNLVFILILMKFYGHVGVACATTIAAIVSFYQYQHGLKKRKYWQFSNALLLQIFKIIFASLFMGLVMYCSMKALNLQYNNWLDFGYMIKIPIFLSICFLGVASFCVIAKLTGAMDIIAIFKMLLKRGNKHA